MILRLSDVVDTPTIKFRQSNNVVSYVPAGSSVELPLTSDVLASYLYGDIRGFLRAGVLSADIVTEDSAPSFESYTYVGGELSSIDQFETSAQLVKTSDEQFTYDGDGKITTSVVTQYDDEGNPISVH